MTTATGNNMHNETPTALGVGLIASVLTYISGMSLTEWAAFIGIVGTVITVALAILRFFEERQLRKLDIAIKQRELRKRGGK
jgi:hypothetical protein